MKRLLVLCFALLALLVWAVPSHAADEVTKAPHKKTALKKNKKKQAKKEEKKDAVKK